MVPSWDRFSSVFVIILLLSLPTFTESINRNSPMTPAVYFSMLDLNNLTSCTDALHVWFCVNGMVLKLTNPKPPYLAPDNGPTAIPTLPPKTSLVVRFLWLTTLKFVMLHSIKTIHGQPYACMGVRFTQPLGHGDF